ncbi:MAG: hypothetical protein GX786_09770, partial [Clostridiales bacterium]|nr:hypothetical protein [Clostridiales bacterium]
MKRENIGKPFQVLLADAKAFLTKYPVLIWVMILVALASFGFEMANFSLTFDEEIELARAYQEPFSNIQVHLENSRFLLAGIRSIFTVNGTFVPYIMTFMAVVWLFASAFLWAILIEKHFTKVSQLSLIAFTTIYMTVPFIIAELMIFAISCDITFFGNFLITFALYLIYEKPKKQKTWHYFLAALTTFVSFSIYQTNVGVFVIGFFALLLLWALNENEATMQVKALCKYSKPYVLIGIVGIVSYLLVTKILAMIFAVQGSYTTNMITWVNEGFSQGIRNIFGSIYRVISPKGNYGSKLVFLTLILLILFVIIYFFRHLNKKGVIIGFISAFFTLSVFTLPIVLGFSAPYRVLLTVLPFMGISWFLFLHYSKKVKWVYVVSVLLVMYVLSQQVLLLNTHFYSSHVMSQTDQWNTKQIARDILQKNNGLAPEIPIIFVGNHEEQVPQAQLVGGIGGSMINWQGTQRRIYDLMYLQGFDFKVDY